MLVNNFVTYSSAMLGRSNRTCSEYAKEVRFFARWLSTDVELTEDEALLVAARSDVQAYIEHCNAIGNAGSTRARKISCLRSFYNFCLESEHVTVNPLAGMPRPKFQRPLPVFLSLHDAKYLIHASRKRNDIFYRHRNTAILQLFLQCGLRLSELSNIRLADCYDDAILILGKGNKERYIVLNVAAQKALKRWLARRGSSPGALWVSKQFTPISNNAVYSIIKNLLRSAGLDVSRLSPHKLRHTAATLLYRYGQVDIRLLQQILGHASIATTEIYTHVADEQIIAAMATHPLANY